MIVSASDFEDWRAAARALLAAGTPPSDVHFSDAHRIGLFDLPAPLPRTKGTTHSVPKAFLELAEAVACHRDDQRWLRLYRVLWRITHGERHVLDLATDDDVHWLIQAEKAVRRDTHKMKAFVRFRKVGDHFIAWHRPDHRIVRRTAPFFQRRFPGMPWTILTPDESATWNGEELTFGPGVPASGAPKADHLEELWKGYYRSTFNPARIKLKAMRKELPVRHWPTLPETAIIPSLLAEAPERVANMVRHSEGHARSAADFLPQRRDLPGLREAARRCTACDLCKAATQTVFGEGPETARIMLVGEQPGDREDIEGRPFVGPAGQLLDEALSEIGLDRNDVYLTNAVKHFKFDLMGVLRAHHRADVREIAACQPWLAAEMEAVRPKVVVCLGATATQSVLGRMFRFTDRRGEVVETETGIQALATFHPAAILRMPNADRAAEMRADLVRHFGIARRLVG
jgi:DNA polymerase